MQQNSTFYSQTSSSRVARFSSPFFPLRTCREVIELVTNRAAIAVNQDSLGVQARLVRSTDAYQVWVGPLQKRKGDKAAFAAVLLNLSNATASGAVLDWKSDLGIDASETLDVLYVVAVARLSLET